LVASLSTGVVVPGYGKTSSIDVSLTHERNEHPACEDLPSWDSRTLLHAVARHLDVLPEGHPISSVLIPYNAFAREAADVFAKSLGMERISLSPFVRAWKLDEIGEDPEEASGILLRRVVSQDLVDHVIVSMRKREWVLANLDAVARLPLTEREWVRLRSWLARVG
jgi:hypothetical protein